MKKNLAKELLSTFTILEESISLYKKVERTYDIPMILDTNVRENINKIYELTLKAIREVLDLEKLDYDKYDINDLILKGKDIGVLTEEIYELLVSNFVQFNDLNMYQQHSVNYLIDWYYENNSEIENFKNYVKEVWENKWFN
ncbi:hypothetical protein [Clostridium massiliamazoniense]|uniref:hypothetical protein n=1 Tax=Clostridium massiliamazoniense TaxID=1347366 RepID=UPI0006D7DDAE|nr:hypothetical protein [Clostridium massiliamazoniense]